MCFVQSLLPAILLSQSAAACYWQIEIACFNLPMLVFFSCVLAVAIRYLRQLQYLLACIWQGRAFQPALLWIGVVYDVASPQECSHVYEAVCPAPPSDWTRVSVMVSAPPGQPVLRLIRL